MKNKYAHVIGLGGLLLLGGTVEAKNLCNSENYLLDSDEVVIERYLAASVNGITCDDGVGIVVESAVNNQRICRGYNIPAGYTATFLQFETQCQHFTETLNSYVIFENTKPEDKAYGISLNVNQRYSGNPQVGDPDGDILNYSISTISPEGGVVSIDTSTGDFNYTPPVDYVGTDFVAIRVNDGKGGVGFVQVFISIGLSNNELVVEEYVHQVNQDETLYFIVSVLNENSQNYNYSLDQNYPPQHGDVQLFTTPGLNRTDTFTYTPDAGFVGEDSFTINVTDGFGRIGSGLIRINVLGGDGGTVVAGETITPALMSIITNLLLQD